jgi:ketosteroid isomerase-like protein
MTRRNQISCTTVLLTFVGSLLSSQTPQKKIPDRQAEDLAAIIALERRDADAAKINDVDTLVSLWTEDGVLLQPRSEPVIGITAIRQLLEQEKQRSANITTVRYEENWKERHITGTDAYEWGEMSVTLRLPDGKQVSQTVYAIRVLRREDGQWKVARSVITPAGHQ